MYRCLGINVVFLPHLKTPKLHLSFPITLTRPWHSSTDTRTNLFKAQLTEPTERVVHFVYSKCTSSPGSHPNEIAPAQGLMGCICALRQTRSDKISTKNAWTMLCALVKLCWQVQANREILSINSGTQRHFSENICSEDDWRSRIFGTFVVKFLACLPLLGFSNI